MERFEFVSDLGEGAYGTVWKALDKETGRMVAMKRFKEAHLDEEVMRLAIREIRLLKASSHPNVVHLYEAFKSRSGRVYMVMELVDHSLTEEVRRHPLGFETERLKIITWQLLQATAFLHCNNIIHRDLKPANILVTKDGVVKLCDFGFARTSSSEAAAFTQYVVTRWYRPPEVLVGGMYGTPVDIWAIGCLFSEMATGIPLFPGRDTLDQLWLTMRTLGPLPKSQMQILLTDASLAGVKIPAPSELRPLSKRFADFTPQMMEVLTACLHPDPAKRLTAVEVLALPYFDDIHDHLSSTALQGAYDEAYTTAVNNGSPAAPVLRTCTSMYAKDRARQSTTEQSIEDSTLPMQGEKASQTDGQHVGGSGGSTTGSHGSPELCSSPDADAVAPHTAAAGAGKMIGTTPASSRHSSENDVRFDPAVLRKSRVRGSGVDVTRRQTMDNGMLTPGTTHRLTGTDGVGRGPHAPPQADAAFYRVSHNGIHALAISNNSTSFKRASEGAIATANHVYSGIHGVVGSGLSGPGGHLVSIRQRASESSFSGVGATGRLPKEVKLQLNSTSGTFGRLGMGSSQRLAPLPQSHIPRSPQPPSLEPALHSAGGASLHIRSSVSLHGSKLHIPGPMDTGQGRSGGASESGTSQRGDLQPGHDHPPASGRALGALSLPIITQLIPTPRGSKASMPHEPSHFNPHGFGGSHATIRLGNPRPHSISTVEY